MKWDRSLVFGVSLGITMGLTITVLLIVGYKYEKETTETIFSVRSGKTEVTLERKTERELEESETPPQPMTSDAKPVQNSQDVNAPVYVGAMYVSGKSTMRYLMDDKNGQVDVYGYDVMRDQRVYCGSGRMVGRKLIVPNFHSFLDDTYGTLTLTLSSDGKTFEGQFEGLNPTQEAYVILARLP